MKYPQTIYLNIILFHSIYPHILYAVQEYDVLWCILNMNFVILCLIPSEDVTQIHLNCYQIFAINLNFLAIGLDFKPFHTGHFWTGPHLFLKLGCFYV